MDLIGHHKIKNFIDEVCKKGTYSHAYLFVGPKNIGKSTFGKYLGQKLLCGEEKAPCGKCLDCRLSEVGNHPDLLVSDSEEAIGIDEVRELIHFLELKPYRAKVKVALITHFERLSVPSANALLKTLEEPAANTVLVITAESIQNVLPTIISRTQVVRFSGMKKGQIAEELKKSGFVEDDVNRALNLSGDRIGRTLELCLNPEKIKENEEYLKKMDWNLFESRLHEKILFAESFDRKKEDLGGGLDLLEVYYESKLKSEDTLKYCIILDKIAKSKDRLNRNGNARMIIESLLFDNAK